MGLGSLEDLRINLIILVVVIWDLLEGEYVEIFIFDVGI